MPDSPIPLFVVVFTICSGTIWGELSSHKHEIAFQERCLGFSKRPYLQRSMKMATRLDPAGRPRPTSRPTPAREGGPLVVESDKDVDWYVRLGARRVSSMRSLPWAPPVIKASIPRK